MNRIIGLISFYNEISSEEGDEDIFPEKNFANDDEIEVFMSNYQFIEYASKRRIERELETSLKRKSASKSELNVNEKIPNLFKVFTRQKGLFVFPPNIARPKPPKKNNLDSFIIKSDYSDITDRLQEIVNTHKENPITHILAESLDEDKQQIANEIFQHSFDEVNKFDDIEDYREYLQSFDFTVKEDIFSYPETQNELNYSEKCIKAINDLSTTNLTVNDDNFNLSVLSPKYVKMLHNIINTPGLVLYSQFRAVKAKSKLVA